MLDDPLFVDYIGFRHAVHAIIDADAAFGIGYDQGIGIAMLAQPGFPFLTLILVVHAVNRHDVPARQFHEHRMLALTGPCTRMPTR